MGLADGEVEHRLNELGGVQEEGHDFGRWTSSRWIRRDGLATGIPHAAFTGCRQGACFHPPRMGAIVGKTPCDSRQASLGGGCGSPQYLCTIVFGFRPNHMS